MILFIFSFESLVYKPKNHLPFMSSSQFVFLCLSIVMNLFEEINFFKDYEVGIKLPILLSTLFVPSMLYNMFPFVILLSGIWFFLKIRKTDEIIAMKISGLSNFSVIVVPSVLSILLGIIFITTVNPLTSALINKYESIKGIYELEQDYLATVTENGIWIKEKSREKIHIIRASKLDAQNLVGLTIYIFDSNNNFLKRIQAKFANISTLNWKINDATVLDQDGKILTENTNNIFYRSMYDIKKIKSLYSNLDTISFWNLEKEIELLKERYPTIPHIFSVSPKTFY